MSSKHKLDPARLEKFQEPLKPTEPVSSPEKPVKKIGGEPLKTEPKPGEPSSRTAPEQLHVLRQANVITSPRSKSPAFMEELNKKLAAKAPDISQANPAASSSASSTSSTSSSSSSTSASSTSLAMPAVNLRDLEKQKMTFEKMLGAQHAIGAETSGGTEQGRRTFQLAIGGRKYAVKIGDQFMADHLMNTDLINKLGIKNVHAPASTELDVEFKQALKQQLIGQGFDPNDKRVLVQALNGNAMISPMAPGTMVTELLYPNPKDSGNVSGKKTLLDYVKTTEGAHALGALITIDLIDGMFDRLVTFNGNNFLFDPAKKELWCVDNAKKPSYALSAKDDISWEKWVIDSTKEIDDKTTESNQNTDKGKSVPELLHWMLYEREYSIYPGFGPQIHWSNWAEEAKKETAAWVGEGFTDTWSALVKLVNENRLPKQVCDRLRPRLAFLDARNKFTDLLSFAEFETIPTTANTWFGLKPIFRAAQRGIGTLSLDKLVGQGLGDQWKSQARIKGADDKQLQPLDETISGYIAGHDGKVDDRVLKALFAVRSARFVLALKAKTDGLVKLQNPTAVKAWGDKLDPAVTERIKSIASKWVQQLDKVGDNEGAKEVIAATDAYLQELQKVAPG